MDGDDRDHEAWRELVTLLPTGLLDQAERSAVRAHLRSCTTCRDELVDVADAPGMLGRLRDMPLDRPPVDARPRDVRADVASRHDPDAGLRDRVVAAARRERARRRRRVGLGVAVTALLAVPLAVALSLRPDDGARLPMTALPAAGGLSASAQVDDREWGTAVTLDVRGDPPVGRIKVVVWDDAGGREVAGWWGTDVDGGLVCEGATSIVLTDLARVAVQDADDEDLLTLDL